MLEQHGVVADVKREKGLFHRSVCVAMKLQLKQRLLLQRLLKLLRLKFQLLQLLLLQPLCGKVRTL
jgi:hypothetical protein